METIKQKIDSYKHYNTAAFAIGVLIKTPISLQLAIEAFEKISNRMPELVLFDFNEEDNILTLKNEEEQTENQILFKLIDYKQFILSWGLNSKVDTDNYQKLLFRSLVEDFKISLFIIENWDVRLYNFASYKDNQYQLIADAFYNNSSIYNLLEKNKIFPNDITIGGILDENTRVYVRVESEQSAKEVLNNKFPNNKTLDATCSVGQIKGFPLSGNLYDVFVEHSKIACDFIKDKYIPNIIEPLEETLRK